MFPVPVPVAMAQALVFDLPSNPEQYEKLFLQLGGCAPVSTTTSGSGAGIQSSGSWKFSNPMPLSILCRLLCFTPTVCYLMGWVGTNPTSAVTMAGLYYFIGGLGMVIGGMTEWVLGNTFPFVVFTVFGGFWLSFTVLQYPMHNLASAFPEGADSPVYNKGLMFYFIFWTMAIAVLFVGSLCTNMIFIAIFFTLIPTFAFLTAGYGALGNGHIGFVMTMHEYTFWISFSLQS
ncbi:hypothetical protein D9758_008681 [Tetrapyrgos nigripes]|uniref:Uncharacterized protein n=1 Tax=Tetrapyrgos nigripes TaxID=182062 RepID=A0A8H5D6L8_9AGAR|nr:hypothetical protein D9758_008681 [Tetrapyrgos nigripes]